MFKVCEEIKSRYDVPVDPDPVPDPDPDGVFAVGTFDHERLDVYRASIQFVGVASRLISSLPTGHSSLAQQLYRASMSIPLNIAEGSGEFSKNDKARFYRIALRSATECAAILDVCRELELTEPTLIQGGRRFLLRIVAMLTSMAKKYSGSGTGSGSGSN
jgi:four helix bundle protein